MVCNVLGRIEVVAKKSLEDITVLNNCGLNLVRMTRRLQAAIPCGDKIAFLLEAICESRGSLQVAVYYKLVSIKSEVARAYEEIC